MNAVTPDRPRRLAGGVRHPPSRGPRVARWGALPAVALAACATFVEPPVLPGSAPTVEVTSRFNADYVHLVGGTITFQTLQGTYNGSCKNPSAAGNFASGTEWYAPIGAYASVPNDWSGAAMTGKLLDLVKNASAGCALTVQALSYTCASCGGISYTLQASSGVTLATTFAGSPVTFTPPALAGGLSQDGDPYYANFYVSALAPWSSNPTIYVLVSNDPSLATSGSATASYVAYNGSTSTTFVAPPDYSVSTGSTTAAVTIASNGTAATVSGGVSLAYGSTPASSAAGCVYTTTAPTQTNAGIATAFAAGTVCPTSGGGQSWATPFHTMFINASNFVSVGNTVPKTGYVIFQNSSSGVSSYEEVSYTFTSTCSAGEVSKTDSSGLGAANACCASASTTLNCDGTCANTQTDPNNCGSCANVCPASAPNCLSGSCVFETDTTDLLANSLFQSGLAPWTLQVQNGAAATQTQDTTTSESSTQSEKITVTTATGATNVELLQTGVSLTAGQLVTVNLWGKASGSFSLPCVLQLAVSPYTNYGSQALAFTTTWTPFSFSYVQTVTDPNAYFDIAVGGSTGSYWFDDIWITAVAAQNVLQNATFSSGYYPWFFAVQGGAAATDSLDTTTYEGSAPSIKVNVTTATASTAYNVQLGQSGLYIPSGTTATVSFWAKASAAIQVQFGLQQAVSPYTTYASQLFTLTTSWADYNFTYASSNSVNTTFVVNYGAATGTVWLDNLAIWNPQ